MKTNHTPTSRATAALLAGVLATCGASVSAQAIGIDTTQSAGRFEGTTLVIENLHVPGLGTYNARFAWNGQGNFTFSDATPAQTPTSPGGGTTAPAGVVRACTIDVPDVRYEYTVYSEFMTLKITSKSDLYVFPAEVNILQGNNFASMFGQEPNDTYVLANKFKWTNPQSFTSGFIPSGLAMTGTVTWLGAPWFNPAIPFAMSFFRWGTHNC